MHKCHAVCADDDFDEVWALVDSFLRFEGEEIDNGVVGYLTQGGYNTQIVFDSSSPYSFDYYKDAERIFWLKPPTAKNKFETPYSPIGNEAALDYAYGDICIVEWVLSAAERV